MYIYLLHFDSPVSPDHTTQHYVGSAEDILKRISQHHRGHGSRLTQVALERGIGFTVVRLWKGNRSKEQRLKSLKCAPKFCPVCNPNNTWKLLHPNLKPVRELNIYRKLGDLKCS